MSTLRRLAATLSAGILIASSVALAPAAAAEDEPSAPATNAQIIDDWYFQFLQRPSDAGASYWVALLDRGDKPSDVLWSLTHTREYTTVVIDDWYGAYLSRFHDNSVDYWIDGVQSGRFSLEDVHQNILASDEFSKKGNLGQDYTVRRWYAALLRRDYPTTGELNYWLGRIDAVGRLAAVREMYYAPDSVNTRINKWYDDLIWRKPDAGGASYWYPKGVENHVNVGVLVASTPEHLAHIGQPRYIEPETSSAPTS